MAAYIIFTREEPIGDEDAMNAYRAGTGKATRPEGMEALAAYGELTQLEGEAPDGAVVLKFPDKATALEWYNQPAYQEALKHRQKAAHYRVFIIEGI